MNLLPYVRQAYTSFVKRRSKGCSVHRIPPLEENLSAAMVVHSRNNNPNSASAGEGRFKRSDRSYGSRNFQVDHSFVSHEGCRFDQEKRHSKSGRQRPRCTYSWRYGPLGPNMLSITWLSTRPSQGKNEFKPKSA
ncbi:unnamed protein product [Dovyalis caffra]|uniref:Uncharacterized protein n=1 Tax=Dovyalis caffra TaxID=77055 RepID=A0AAV1SFD4_9ROSI|nr:unnamed protein product [Dovyalis caffra]